MAEPDTEAGPNAFVADLWAALHRSAEIARALEGRVRNEPKDGEATAVKAALTLADMAAQEALLVPLLARFSDVRLEAEEDTESVHRFSGRRAARVVIDPIDGTLRSYLHGHGPYAVLAGLAVEDVYRAALVALPREGHFFSAVEGGGALHARHDAEPEPICAHAEGDEILISYDLPEPVADRLKERGYRTRFACGGAIAVAPLLPGVVGGLRVPSPRPLSVRGRIGLLVSEEAGARVVTRAGPAGRALSEPLPHVALAADEATLRDLVYALEADR